MPFRFNMWQNVNPLSSEVLCPQALGFVSKAVNSAIVHVRSYCASSGGEKSVSKDDNHGPSGPPLQVLTKTRNEAVSALCLDGCIIFLNLFIMYI